MKVLKIQEIYNYNDLKVNDSFMVLIEGMNNSNCSFYHDGPHGDIRDHNTTEIYKVKAIHSGGIYSTEKHPMTIETYCNCFIRVNLRYIVKVV